jgi:hypothetical protein
VRVLVVDPDGLQVGDPPEDVHDHDEGIVEVELWVVLLLVEQEQLVEDDAGGQRGHYGKDCGVESIRHLDEIYICI